jgi:hypothetical protein
MSVQLPTPMLPPSMPVLLPTCSRLLEQICEPED